MHKSEYRHFMDTIFHNERVQEAHFMSLTVQALVIFFIAFAISSSFWFGFFCFVVSYIVFALISVAVFYVFHRKDKDAIY